MKVILTETQIKDLIFEERFSAVCGILEGTERSAARSIIKKLAGVESATVIFRTLAKYLKHGTITMVAVPLILGMLLGSGLERAGVREKIMNGLETVWEKVKSGDEEVTAQMQADAEEQAATIVSQEALAQICKWETGKDLGYTMGSKDLRGYIVPGEKTKTYGYGLKTHPNGKMMQNIKPAWSQEELESLFKEKLKVETDWVLKWANEHGVTLKQGQLDAMVSAVYNYGRAGFMRTGIPAMIAKNPSDPRIPEVWAHASDHRKKMGGLHARRREEARWYLNDIENEKV